MKIRRGRLLPAIFLLLSLFTLKLSCFCEHIVVSSASHKKRRKNLFINDSLSVFHLLYELPVGSPFLLLFPSLIHFSSYFPESSKSLFSFDFGRKNASNRKNLFRVISLFIANLNPKVFSAGFIVVAIFHLS